MSTFPGSPRLVKGGIVLLDSSSGAIQRVIALQYNPDTVTRTLQVQGAGQEQGDHLEALRLKGPPIETIKVEVEIDAADQLETAAGGSSVLRDGIEPALAALETIVYPASATLRSNAQLASFGTLEITPALAPLSLFVWSRNRVVPVRITELSVTEDAFDPALNPLRAKVSLGLRVLSVNDVGFGERASDLYLAYQQQKERLAASAPSASLGTLGITSLP